MTGRRWCAALLAGAVLLAVPAAGAEVPTPARGSAAARLSEGGSASEYWDLTARFESGDTLLVRFLITNQGPGARTAIAQGYLIRPDGRVVPFINGREAGRWTLSTDRLSIDIGSSELDLRGPVRRFAVDNDKRGVKIHLSLPVQRPPLWSAARDGPDDVLDLLQVSDEVSGTIWLQGMAAVESVRGRAALTHTWLTRGHEEVARRQIEFFGLGEATGIYVTDILPTAGAARRWLAVVRGDGVEQRDGGELTLGAPLSGAGDYPLPRMLTIASGGIEARIEVERELVRVDPFDVIPQPFRFLLSLRSKPMRIWAAATCTLVGPEGATAATVQGVVAISYANPLPDRR